ncbi:MAG: putative 4-hydroxybenzoate polyprenyltransferase [Thermoanaerobaculales bacterium]|nr:putative 4-hydroxybenzoate polyprenyltransferase [Thermoanaerobaculales bacterium]
MIKFQHTVFALPFAVIALVSAFPGAYPPLRIWLLVLAAMITARTAAMAFNRLVDHGVDLENPRTASRSLPAGRLGRGYVWGVTLVSSFLFVVAAGMLNRLCLILALPTLVFLLGYSYTKRFTAASHLWLGASLGLAPVGAWVAATGRLQAPAVILGAGVLMWVAGFDIIYSLQDEAFDRLHGLHSVPSYFGAQRALLLSRLLHIGACLGFAVFAVQTGGGPLRFSAVAGAAALLTWQHSLVRPGDLSRVDAAFFTANGVLSVIMGLLFVAAGFTDVVVLVRP